MIIEDGLNFLHKVKINKIPQTIMDQFNNICKNQCKDGPLYTTYIHKCKMFIVHERHQCRYIMYAK